MYLVNYLASLLLVFSLFGEIDVTQSTEVEDNTPPKQKTIEIIGIDKMKFAVNKNAADVVVGEPISTADGKRYLELQAIKVEPGTRLTVKLISKSELPPKSMSHNWVLLKQESDRAEFDKAAVLAVENNYIPPQKEDEVIANTGLAAGGETASATFQVPEKQGMYDYLCSFPGHFANGMRGKLIVQEQM
jgi:azurin